MVYVLPSSFSVLKKFPFTCNKNYPVQMEIIRTGIVKCVKLNSFSSCSIFYTIFLAHYWDVDSSLHFSTAETLLTI